MKVYLAAPYAARAQIKRYASEVTRIGYKVTSRWLDETHEVSEGTIGAAGDLDDTTAAGHASDDLFDISRADLFVLFTAAQSGLNGGPGAAGTSGGRHVETGYAIARDIPIIVVGEPENIFHRLGSAAMCVPNWHEAVLELSARLVQDRRSKAAAL